MSRASSGKRGVYVEGPKNDVFTALLVVALIAIIFACLFLVLEWSTYDFKTSPSATLGAPSSPAVAWHAEFPAISARPAVLQHVCAAGTA
jgi:hypothetical protein